MNRKTFEIIAKWIGNETRTKIVFDDKVPGPIVNMKTKTITLPNISSQKALAGLCDVMHEAGHLRYSNDIPEFVMRTPVRKDIINVLEDIRIDLKIMKKLPNIRMFYEVSNQHAPRERSCVKQKTLIDAICHLEQLKPIFEEDRPTREFKNRIGFSDFVRLCAVGVTQMNFAAWRDVDEIVTKILKQLEIKEEPQEQPQPQPGSSGESGQEQQSSGDPQESQGEQPPQPQEQEPEQQPEKKPDKKSKKKPQPQPESPPSIPNLDVRLHGKHSNHWGQGTLEGKSQNDFLNQESSGEIMKQTLAEALKISETQTIDDGTLLNTESLPSFLTGDIEELFYDEVQVKVKKSVVLFLLDASGSMDEPMTLSQGHRRCDIVRDSTLRMIDSIKQIISVEGLDVSYLVRFFQSDYIKPNDNEDWVPYYRTGGGTCLNPAVYDALREIKSHEYDGKKIIICLTDGQVSEDDISKCEKRIIESVDDSIRLMFIGVDVEMSAKTANLIHDNIIVTHDIADETIVRGITNCLI